MSKTISPSSLSERLGASTMSACLVRGALGLIGVATCFFMLQHDIKHQARLRPSMADQRISSATVPPRTGYNFPNEGSEYHFAMVRYLAAQNFSENCTFNGYTRETATPDTRPCIVAGEYRVLLENSSSLITSLVDPGNRYDIQRYSREGIREPLADDYYNDLVKAMKTSASATSPTKWPTNS